MTKEDYCNTAFYFGIEAKVDGMWHKVISADFDDMTIDIDEIGESYSTIQVQDIEDFSRLKVIPEGGADD